MNIDKPSIYMYIVLGMEDLQGYDPILNEIHVERLLGRAPKYGKHFLSIVIYATMMPSEA